MSLAYLKASLESEVGNLHCLLMDFSAASVALVTGNVNTTTNRIDLTSAFTPAAVVGTRVSFSGLSNTTNLSNSTTYYVVNVSGTEVQLSALPGGSAIDLTVTFSGTCTEVAPLLTSGLNFPSNTETVADAVRHEVASYGDLSTRPVFTDPVTATLGAYPGPTGSTVTGKRGAFSSASVSLSTATPVEFTHLALVSGGAATPGNTTGLIAGVILPTGSPITATTGSTVTVSLARPM